MFTLLFYLSIIIFAQNLKYVQYEEDKKSVDR